MFYHTVEKVGGHSKQFFVPHAENRQNLSISRMSTNKVSQHDKTTAHLVNFMPYTMILHPSCLRGS